jgi:LmbE family N-acetylglucosaminyl deacetylase
MTAFVAEQTLIPYSPSSFSARRVLVLAPHPDDEVFGCGAALADLASRGAALDVLVLTDGAGGEPDPAERKRIEGLRLRESGVALAILGGAKLRTAGLPDRGLWDAEAALREALERALVETGPDLVFAPSPVEIHPDHRAVAAALVAVARSAAPSSPVARVLAGTTVAFFEVSQPFRPNVLFDCGRHTETKRRAMLAFVSQNGERDYEGFISGLNAYRRMTLPRGTKAAEGYFVVPGSDLSRGIAFLSQSMSPFAGLSP